MKKLYHAVLFALLCGLAPLVANAQSFRVQCPTSTITHPNAAHNNLDRSAYNGPTQFTPQSQTAPGWSVPTAGTENGAIRCQQISGGDGYMTEGDGRPAATSAKPESGPNENMNVWVPSASVI